jgi:hypothetical protein
MPKARDQIAELREAYRNGWEPTVKFIQWAREIEATPDETPTAALSDTLRLKPAEAKELFEGIEVLGLGKFIVGRRGSPSRLQWQYTLSSIAAVATAEADAFEPASRSSLPKRDSSDQFIEYVFQLRRDLKIKFALPADFSQQDIVRLTAFLQTLPLSGDD